MIGHGCMIGPPAASGKGIQIIPTIQRTDVIGITYSIIGWKWIKIYQTESLGEVQYIVVPEMEILNELNENIATGGTPYASSALYSPSYAFDGILEGYYMTPWKTVKGGVYHSWLAYYKETGMDAKKIRFYKNNYQYYSFTNAIAYGSNNSTDGVDGDWEQLVSGITVGNSGWTEYQIQMEA